MAFVKRSLIGVGNGLVATALMSLAMAAAHRSGLLGEPPPRRITRRLLARLGMAQRGAALDTAATLAHFAFGAAMGVAFAGLPRPVRRAGAGTIYGLGVWAVNYSGLLPKLRLYPSPEQDRPGRPSAMVAAHLVFGATLAGLDRMLEAGARRAT